MQIAISGSTGLVGRALVSHLEDAGHEITRLVRPGTPESADGIPWDPATGELDAGRLEGYDTVVHLAGEPIDQRWTKTTKQRILDSRVQGTELIATTLAKLDDPPDVLVSASAVGYYGDRGDTWLEEDAGPGDLFISEVCQRWEAAARPAAENGVRVVNLRTGIVLSDEGGALARMLPFFKAGLGGHLGSGDQYVPWITREDMVRTIEHLIDTDDVEGPVNVCTPEPATNKALTKALGKAIGRPTILWVPSFGVRLMYGQMGEELLLASDRTRPAKLEESGYTWEHTDLEDALSRVLGRD